MSAYTRSMDGTLVNGHTCLSHSITVSSVGKVVIVAVVEVF